MKLNVATKSNVLFNRLIYIHIYILPLSFLWYAIGFGSTLIMASGYLTILIGSVSLVTGRARKIPNYAYLLLVYFFYKVISDYLFNSQMESSISSVLKYASPYLAFFFFVVLLENIYIINDKLLLTAKKVIVATVFVAPLISFIQIFNPEFTLVSNKLIVSGGESIYQIRRGSLFDLESNTSFVLSFLPMLALVISFFIRNGRFKNAGFLMLIASIPVFLSNTRVVMLGYAIIFVMLLFQGRSNAKGIFRSALIILTITVTLYVLLNYVGYDLDHFYDERIKEGPLDASPRYDSYLAFFNVFPKSPVFGTGDPSSDVIANSLSKNRNFIHIGWLSHLATYGMVGSLLFFGFIYQLMKSLYKTAKDTNFYAPLFAFTIYIMANFTFVETNFFTSGLILSLVFSRYYLLQYHRSTFKSNI